MKKGRILQDLSLLVEAGLITPQQSQAIEEFYQQRKKEIRPLLLLPLIGVLLVGTGFISLCASNWHYLSDVVKIVLAFVPLVLLSGFLYKHREADSQVLVQCLTFGVGFGVLFAFGVLANVFQTPVSTHLLMQFAVLCLVPLVYVFDAYWLGVLLFAWGIFACSTTTLVLSLLSLVAFVPYCWEKIQWEASHRSFTVLHIVALFRLLFLFHSEGGSVLLALALLLLASTYYTEEFYQKIVREGFLWLGVFLCFVEESFFSLSDAAFLVLSLLPVVAICFAIGQRMEEREEQVEHGCCLAVLVLFFLCGVGFPTLWIATLLITAILVTRAYHSFHKRDLAHYNGYSFLFTAFVLAKMSSLHLSFLATGVLFILLGISFILLSKKLADTIKREEQEYD